MKRPRQITEELWTIGKRAMVTSLVILHLWGSVILYRLYKDDVSAQAADMFRAIVDGIFWCLAVLYSGKAADKLLALKWGGEPEQNRVQRSHAEDTSDAARTDG